MKSIPRVNLSEYHDGDGGDKKHFIQTLGDGLKYCGFLNVENHGLDPNLIQSTYDMFKKFFNLDEQKKRSYDRIPGGARGYTPFGREHAKYTTIPDLKEFWHIGQELPQGHAYGNEYPANIWPDEIPELKETALSLFRAYERCAQTLLEALAIYFHLPKDCFSKMVVDGNSIFRIIHYPPLAADVPAGAVRAAAHEDINLITLLTQSEGQGLEILTQDKTWFAVDALEGDIVVDSGDMLSRVTNGVIPSTTHRVVNPPDSENKSRYSMPFFVHPYSVCDLTVMDRFTSKEHPPKWPPITAGDFLQQRLDEIGLTKKA